MPPCSSLSNATSNGDDGTNDDNGKDGGNSIGTKRAVSDRADRVTAPMRSSRQGLPDQRRDEDHRNDAPLETIGVQGDAAP